METNLKRCSTLKIKSRYCWSLHIKYQLQIIAKWFLYYYKANQLFLSLQQVVILLSFMGSSYCAENI